VQISLNWLELACEIQRCTSSLLVFVSRFSKDLCTAQMKQKALEIVKTNTFVQHTVLLIIVLLLTFFMGSILTWIAVIGYGVYSSTKSVKASKAQLYQKQETKEELDKIHDRAQECHWLNMFVHKYWATCIDMVLAPHVETLSALLTASKPPFLVRDRFTDLSLRTKRFLTDRTVFSTNSKLGNGPWERTHRKSLRCTLLSNQTKENM
jgi:hypothetical protein